MKNSKLIKHIVTCVTAVVIVSIIVYPGNLQNFRMLINPDSSIEIEANFYHVQ